MSEVKSGAVLAYVNVALSNVSVLIYLPILTRMLGQADYGVFKLSDSVIASLSLLSFGFGAAYVRFYARLKVKNDEKGIANLNGMYLILFVAMGLVAGLAGWLISVLVPQLFGETLTIEEVSLAKTLMILMGVNVALTFPTSVFASHIQVHERFRFIYSLQLFVKVLGPVVGVGLLLLGWGAVGASLATLFTTIVSLFWNAIYALRHLKMRFEFFPFNGKRLKEIAVFSGWIFLSQLFNLLTDNASNFIVAARVGAVASAVFSIAFQIRQLFFALSVALSGLFAPRINTMVAEKQCDDLLLQLMIRVGRYQMILHLTLLGGFILVGQYFLKLWVGNGYEQAYWLVLIMAGSVTAPLAQNIGIQIQQAKNMHKFRSVAYLISAVAGAVFSWLLAPQLGALAGALGYALTMVVGTWFLMNWYYHVKVGLHMGHFWRAILPVVITMLVCLSGFLSVTVLFFPVNSLVRLIVVGVLFVMVIGCAMWGFVLKPTEKQELLGMFRRKRGI